MAATTQRLDDTRRENLRLVGIVAVILISYPLLDAVLNLQTIGAMLPIFLFVLLALGLNIVVGFAGLLDLGYAAFFAIGAYTAAFLTSPVSPLPFRTDFWVAMVLSFVVAMFFGVVLGTPTLRLRGDYLAIVTLAFGEIVPRVFLNLEQWTGGSKGMNPIGRPHFFGIELGPSDRIAWFYLVLVVGAISVWAIGRLRDSRLGRAWVAMREDELAAASLGIDLVRTKLLAFALGASFSGFAGSMFASLFQFIDPSQFDFSISILVLCMVILGGSGNVYGVIVGGIILASFDRILADRITTWIHSFGTALHAPILLAIDLTNARQLVFGLALVLLMLFRPAGIFPPRGRAMPDVTESDWADLDADDEFPASPTTVV